MNIVKRVKGAIDRMTWTIAPSWMIKRQIFGAIKVYAQRSLKAASIGRLYSGWLELTNTPNAYIFSIPLVSARANALYLNDPFIRGAVDLIVNRMIGAGSTVQATTADEGFNQSIEELFSAWCENADFYGQFHFADMERLAILKLFLDGGVFFRKIVDNRRRNPFCLEVIEYSRLANMGRAQSGNVVVNGVEVDKLGRVVAYHFKTGHTQDIGFASFQPRRVDASEVIHFSPFRRPGQVLGIPLLAPAIPYALSLSDLIEAELITKKIEACFGIAIKTSNVWNRVQAAQETSEGREIEIAPGMVEHLAPGEEIEVIDPKRPGKGFKDFVKIILSGIARSIGLSYEQISGDKSEVNYSSTRHSELELRDFMTPFRAADERYLLRPIWREFVRFSVLSGQVKAKTFVDNPAHYMRHRWIFKGFDWIDPKKEAEAKRIELRMGMTTLADECAAKGKDWQDIIRQRAKEKEFMNNLGLVDVSQLEREDGNGNKG